MKWPACSPDLSSIENIWNILKGKLYPDGWQFSTKEALWEAVVDDADSITLEEIVTLMNSMDKYGKDVLSW